MNLPEPRALGRGATQALQRDHNERLILSTIQRHGSLSGGEVARLARLSPQTASVILRGLEAEGLVERGDPQRGRVGAPRLPVRLAPDGAFAVGLKIGRRSADLLLVDFIGGVRHEAQATYRWPAPPGIFAFLRDGLAAIGRALSPEQAGRIAGIGIAKPYEIWDWHEAIGAPPGALDAWRDVDYAREVAAFSDLPVFLQNDGTAACRAELAWGRGREFRDWAYFFVGSFIGGGVVINHSVFDGAFGNAGAFGSLPVPDGAGRPRQLIDTASLFLLEDALVRRGLPPQGLWARPQDWGAFGAALDPWIEATARQLARAAVTVCAVIDFEAVLVDGAFPPDVRARLVAGRATSSGASTGGACRPSASRRGGRAATRGRWVPPPCRWWRDTSSMPTRGPRARPGGPGGLAARPSLLAQALHLDGHPRDLICPLGVGHEDGQDLVELLELGAVGHAVGHVDLLVVVRADGVGAAPFHAVGHDAPRLDRHPVPPLGSRPLATPP
jgi:predicted NBD/HSP70 family sugar kinase